MGRTRSRLVRQPRLRGLPRLPSLAGLPSLPRVGPAPGAAARREPDVVVRVDDGARLAAWVREPDGGPGDPPTVVLVHGWTQAAAAWDRAVAALEVARPDVRVVRYDQRGHGASRTPGSPRPRRGTGRGTGRPAPATIGRLGDDMAQVVAALAPRGPLVLAGHSMGGMAVLAAAGAHPGLLTARPCGLLLCSTTAGGLSAGRPVVPVMAALAALPPGVHIPRAPRLLTQRTSYGPGADAALVRETLRAIGPVSGRSTGEWFAALMAHDETAALPVLAATGVPVRVLVGDADRLTPQEHAAALVAALPGAGLTVVPGAGHMLFVERPDVVVDAVVALLAAAVSRGPAAPAS